MTNKVNEALGISEDRTNELGKKLALIVGFSQDQSQVIEMIMKVPATETEHVFMALMAGRAIEHFWSE